MTANYQIWVLNDDYSKRALLANAGNTRTWSRLYYRQALNDIGSCSVDLIPNSVKISDLALGRRLQVIRDGVTVWAGMILREEWNLFEEAPAGDTYQIHALDYGVWADWRDVVPAAGQEYDQRVDHADDLAKAYVYYHAGAGAAAARQTAGLTVQADAHAASSITEQARYDNLLTELKALGQKGAFRWRFVPGASGAEFKTALIWGLDRTQGNGVNAECVLSLDRRNVSRMSYTNDVLAHRNYIYVAGQGEGKDRTVVERSNATYITAYKRRESFVDARDLSATASLNTRGDGKLVEMKPLTVMSAVPKLGTWKTLWDLGDYVTLNANRYGRTFTTDAEIMAVRVEIYSNEIEHVTPEMAAI